MPQPVPRSTTRSPGRGEAKRARNRASAPKPQKSSTATAIPPSRGSYRMAMAAPPSCENTGRATRRKTTIAGRPRWGRPATRYEITYSP